MDAHEFDERREFRLNDHEQGAGPVLYWMHRDHRLRDNWGLLRAQQLALAKGAPLAVVWVLASSYPGAVLRHYDFLLRGLETTAREIEAKKIPFFLLQGDPAMEVAKFVNKVRAGAVVTDFDPLRFKRAWVESVVRELEVAVREVDSRNIVPCRAVSDKQEYAARTIRPKIHRLLDEFLFEPPQVEPHPHPWPGDTQANDFVAALKRLNPDASVPPVDWLEPGEEAAAAMLGDFIDNRLADYDAKRNDPNADAQSNLSPYLHFGMLSSLRAAMAAAASRKNRDSIDAFLEELIVRRELTDNYCLHNPDYDSVEGFPDWAQKTLEKHAKDKREYVYTEKELETAQTHEALWNAAQTQLVQTGKMHGYLRMYWAKKILEWTKTPQEALKITIRLNDRYSLDGRDPNGYVGAAWAIGGLHDRPWKERPIFGTIRYMNEKGARRKFDVDGFVERVLAGDGGD